MTHGAYFAMSPSRLKPAQGDAAGKQHRAHLSCFVRGIYFRCAQGLVLQAGLPSMGKEHRLSAKEREAYYAARRTNPVPGLAWIPLIIGALLLGFFNEALAGWGLPSAIAAGVILLPILQYKRYWCDGWFWLTLAALSLAQVPLIIFTRPLMEQFRFGFNLVFGVADLFLVVLIINWVSPAQRE